MHQSTHICMSLTYLLLPLLVQNKLTQDIDIHNMYHCAGCFFLTNHYAGCYTRMQEATSISISYRRHNPI